MGRGQYAERRWGGLYLASTMAGSTAVWGREVSEPGPGGDCSHVELGEPDRTLNAGELVWMTDSCPHASMPTAGGPRQFFRLVTREVDLWFAANSTANPLGVAPPERVQIVTESKFA